MVCLSVLEGPEIFNLATICFNLKFNILVIQISVKPKSYFNVTQQWCLSILCIYGVQYSHSIIFNVFTMCFIIMGVKEDD